MTTKFYCDKCGKEFFNEEECRNHEKMCGIDTTKLHFVLWDYSGKKVSSNDFDDTISIGFDYIYIEDANTFTVLNEFWKENGHITIADNKFEEKST